MEFFNVHRNSRIFYRPIHPPRRIVEYKKINLLLKQRISTQRYIVGCILVHAKRPHKFKSWWGDISGENIVYSKGWFFFCQAVSLIRGFFIEANILLRSCRPLDSSIYPADSFCYFIYADLDYYTFSCIIGLEEIVFQFVFVGRTVAICNLSNLLVNLHTIQIFS